TPRTTSRVTSADTDPAPKTTARSRPSSPDALPRADRRLREQLERAAYLRVREAAEAAHLQERVDANRRQPGDLLGHFVQGADQPAAHRGEPVVGPSAPHPARPLPHPDAR